MSGCLFIVAAPSGAGKSSLVNALLARETSIQLSISYTSRAPRPGESEGSHYHFVTRGEFEAMWRAASSSNMPWAWRPEGNARHTVERPLTEGVTCCWRSIIRERGRSLAGAGLRQRVHPSAVAGGVERRLRGRGQDAEDVIQRRLADSATEIAHLEDFDYLLVNDVFERALDDLFAIVRRSDSSASVRRAVRSH